MTLHPTVAELDRQHREDGYLDPFAAETGTEARERAWKIRREIYPSPYIAVGSVTERTISGPAGDIPVRVIRPTEAEATGTVVYFHGGGWIVGNLDSHAAHVARIANRTRSVVINVDYRLAPENPFPAGIDDAFAAFDWVAANIGEFGGDAAKLVVAGDSSGGNFAAVTAIHARDANIPLACQMLIYPATDMRKRAKTQAPGGVSEKYLGPDYKTVADDPRASPAATPSLAGVAPAIIGVGVHDFLYEDSVEYVSLLREAGVDVTFREFPDLNHSFFSYTGVSARCEEAANLMCDDLRTLLHQ